MSAASAAVVKAATFPPALQAQVEEALALGYLTVRMDVRELAIPGMYRCTIVIPEWTFEFYVDNDYPAQRPYAMFYHNVYALRWRELTALPFSWSPDMKLTNLARALSEMIPAMSKSTGIEIGKPMKDHPIRVINERLFLGRRRPDASSGTVDELDDSCRMPSPPMSLKRWIHRPLSSPPASPPSPTPLASPLLELASPSIRSPACSRLKTEMAECPSLTYAGDGWWTIECMSWIFRFLISTDYPFSPPVMTMYRHKERDPDPDQWAVMDRCKVAWQAITTLELLAMTLAVNLNSDMHGTTAIVVPVSTPPPAPRFDLDLDLDDCMLSVSASEDDEDEVDDIYDDE